MLLLEVLLPEVLLPEVLLPEVLLPEVLLPEVPDWVFPVDELLSVLPDEVPELPDEDVPSSAVRFRDILASGEFTYRILLQLS